MFSQKPEEKAAWAPLPSEPLDRDDATDLPEAPVLDPLALGLDGGTGVSIDVSGAVSAAAEEARTGAAAPGRSDQDDDTRSDDEDDAGPEDDPVR